VPTLRGKTIINLFYEASTRTRTSFEIAGKKIKRDTINISSSTSSVVKGERLNYGPQSGSHESDVISSATAPPVLPLAGITGQAIHYQRRRRRSRTPHTGLSGHDEPSKNTKAKSPIESAIIAISNTASPVPIFTAFQDAPVLFWPSGDMLRAILNKWRKVSPEWKMPSPMPMS